MCQISIVVPVYNASLYLKDCLDSILCQTFPEFELLLIDDGSNDGSDEICDIYAAKDSRIRVVHQRNGGVSTARNTALNMACGKWITFADADDLMMPDALQVLISAALEDNTDIVLSGSDVLVHGNQKPYHIYSESYSENALEKMSHPALWGYMIRASLIQKNNIRFVPGIAYSEDVVFLANVAICAKGIKVISKSVYIYRRNDFSACAIKNGVMTSEHQFHAAYSIAQLERKEVDKKKKKFLKKKKEALIHGGCYDFAMFSWSLTNYRIYEKQYLKYFKNRRQLLIKTIQARLLVIRRKMIQLNDDPLSGRDGIITKIKNIIIKIVRFRK